MTLQPHVQHLAAGIPTALTVRYGNESDLPAFEWDGEFTHFRRLFADVFQQVSQGKSLIWVAELPRIGLIGQLFVSFESSRNELADGSTRVYLFGFRIRSMYRNKGVGTYMLRIVEEDLIYRGFLQITLNVSRENLLGLKFYKKMGYQIIAADPGKWIYFDNDGRCVHVHEPAWRMMKNLSMKDHPHRTDSHLADQDI